MYYPNPEPLNLKKIKYTEIIKIIKIIKIINLPFN